MSVRLKMTCQGKTEGKATIGDPENPGNTIKVDTISATFVPVYTGSEENKRFFAATPSGSLTFSTVNKAAAESIEEGKDYFVVVSES